MITETTDERRERHERMMASADAAATFALSIRAYHRKRTKIGHHQRNADIDSAQERIRDAMRPIRSALGRAPYDTPGIIARKRNDELKAASLRVQSERRKLWKLRGGKTKGRR